jgi:hypothetical protein
MIEFALPTAAPREMTLEPRVERAGVPVAPLPRRISIGGPLAVPLDVERLADDDDLVTFVERETTADFFLVHLAATFIPDRDEPLEKVWLTVRLRRLDEEPEPQPIAWSMRPNSLYDEVERSSKVRIGPSLKIAEVGVAASVESGTTQVLRDVSLEARYELQANPTWVLERTRSAPIRGVQRFVLVVRSPRGVSAGGVVETGAIVRRRVLGPITHRATLEVGTPEISFQLA